MYDPNEQDDVLTRFMVELRKPTGDGGAKRSSGNKVPWYEDKEHLGAFKRHLDRWLFEGEKVDPDSGAHPLAHAAWRLLAIVCVETGNVP